MTFHEKLGSMLDKNERVAVMVDLVAAQLGTPTDVLATAKQAALLAKADLATQMVVEMTSLQGTMGREYALLNNAPRAVADAIYEHWLPRGADDALPSSPAGVLLALTDRLDSLIGLFAAGVTPTSTADPFGLRRAALGIVQIVVDQKIDIDLKRLIKVMAAGQPIIVAPEVRGQVAEFIAGRFRAWLDDSDAPRDVIAAVLAAQATNPVRALAGIAELSAWTARPDWTPLLDGFARCVRITRSETTQHGVDPVRLVEPEEQALYAAVQSATAGLPDNANVDAFLSAFAPLLPVVTTFFDKVLVNADDPAVRASRLGLLQMIARLQTGRADMSLLSGF
jgi:glycyl-tRNA synthetase